MGRLADWLSDWLKPGTVWYLKRLSANDTLANKAHQAGPYVPREILFKVFPGLDDPSRKNPDIEFDACIDSHADQRKLRAIWYNNRLFGGTRNEARITNWGGAASPVLDPDATGALAAFAFTMSGSGKGPLLRVWLCRNTFEEDVLEDRIMSVEPGKPVALDPAIGTGNLLGETQKQSGLASCRLAPEDLPRGWRLDFPAGQEIVRKVCELRPAADLPVDERLVKRRDCEFELFQAIEDVIESDNINRQFLSVSDFLSHAQRILQRRKARSGRSLELQTRAILLEEGFVEGRDFSHQPESEPAKRPDFLFPSEAAYKNPAFPSEHLRMLATKTTCRDRWRQVISEADRIAQKHLLTLQEGVSVNQHTEMRSAGVRLVVPRPLLRFYPDEVRPHLVPLEQFFVQLRDLVRPTE